MNQLQDGLDIIIGFKDENNKLHVISNDSIIINDEFINKAEEPEYIRKVKQVSTEESA